VKRIILLVAAFVLAASSFPARAGVAADHATFAFSATAFLQRVVDDHYESAYGPLLAYSDDAGVVHVRLKLCPSFGYKDDAPVKELACDQYSADSDQFSVTPQTIVYNGVSYSGAAVIADVPDIGHIDAYWFGGGPAGGAIATFECPALGFTGTMVMHSTDLRYSAGPGASGTFGTWQVHNTAGNCMLYGHDATFVWIAQ
jgi:hypothetical protein